MEQLHLDDDCWKILKSLTLSPKSPQVLSKIYGMPIADTWKRVRFLEGLGLVHVVLTFLDRQAHVVYFYEADRPLTVTDEVPPSIRFEPAD